MVSYKITLRNREGDVILVLPSAFLHSFTYSKYLRTGGNFEIRLHNVERFNALLDLPDALDYEWTVEMLDSRFQTDWHKESVTLHRALELEQLDTLNWLCRSYGIGLPDLLLTEGTGYDNGSRSGLIKDVAVAYATDLLSQFPSITVAPAPDHTSIEWSGDRRYKKLSVILSELADADNAQYTIDNDYVFRWFYPENNGVVLHPGIGQVTKLRVNKNYISLPTHITLLGTGIGVERPTVTVYNNEYYKQYGEFYYQHLIRPGVGDSADLTVKGTVEIEERLNSLFEVTFEIPLNSPNLVYIRDFDVGDVMSLNLFGTYVDILVYVVYVTLNKDNIRSVQVGCKII